MTDFDPTYGYTLEQLLRIEPPPQPEGFAAFWQARYTRAIQLDPHQRLKRCDLAHPDFECYDLH